MNEFIRVTIEGSDWCVANTMHADSVLDGTSIASLALAGALAMAECCLPRPSAVIAKCVEQFMMGRRHGGPDRRIVNAEDRLLDAAHELTEAWAARDASRKGLQ